MGIILLFKVPYFERILFNLSTSSNYQLDLMELIILMYFCNFLFCIQACSRFNLLLVYI